MAWRHFKHGSNSTNATNCTSHQLAKDIRAVKKGRTCLIKRSDDAASYKDATHTLWLSWLAPSMSDVQLGARKLEEILAGVRWAVLLSWALFLVLPAAPRQNAAAIRRLSTLSFVVGMALYFYMLVGLYWQKPCHHMQPLILFIPAAACMIPAIHGGWPLRGEAASWLGQYLLFGIMAPLYLTAGLCKIRYHGVTQVFLSSGWIDFALGSYAASDQLGKGKWYIPQLSRWMLDIDRLVPLFSWGGMLFEVAMPAAVIVLSPTSRWHRPVRQLFAASAIGFHVSMFFVCGANFWYNGVLAAVLLAADLMDASPAPELAHSGSSNSVVKMCMSAFTSAMLFGWLLTCIDADMGFALSKGAGWGEPRHKGVDRLLPFSLHAMYTKGMKRGAARPGAASSMTIAALVAAGYVWNRRRT